MSSCRTFLATLLLLASIGVAPASAGQAWDEIRGSVFGTAPITDGAGIVHLSAPTRPDDMREVPIGVSVALADGRTIKSITVLIDNNPTPVVARFDFPSDRDRVAVTANYRVDSQSDVRAVVEASDGQLLMVSQLIKFAGGQASCSAPPQGDPAEIAANMGKMSVEAVAAKKTAGVSSVLGKARLVLNHPNHTGMVMDQQTLLYTPMRMISKVDVSLGGEPVMSVEGSIALSQNPVFEFDYKRNASTDMVVTFRDTDETEWSRSFIIGPQS